MGVKIKNMWVATTQGMTMLMMTMTEEEDRSWSFFAPLPLESLWSFHQISVCSSHSHSFALFYTQCHNKTLKGHYKFQITISNLTTIHLKTSRQKSVVFKRHVETPQTVLPGQHGLQLRSRDQAIRIGVELLEGCNDLKRLGFSLGI